MYITGRVGSNMSRCRWVSNYGLRENNDQFTDYGRKNCQYTKLRTPCIIYSTMYIDRRLPCIWRRLLKQVLIEDIAFEDETWRQCKFDIPYFAHNVFSLPDLNINLFVRSSDERPIERYKNLIECTDFTCYKSRLKQENDFFRIDVYSRFWW